MSGSTVRKKVPKKNVPKEALHVTALKKKEVTIRAMAIIERMIEGKVQEKWLLDSVHFITQDQYQDVIEERAITKLCGYSLCGNVLKNIPSKTFHISTKQNKVYDITERKNFCSNGCYKASVFLKNQLLSSPLWLRDAEEKPDYKIFHFREGGSLGAEVDLGHKRVRLSEVNVSASEESEDETNHSLSEKLSKCSPNINPSESRKKNEEVERNHDKEINKIASELKPSDRKVRKVCSKEKVLVSKTSDLTPIKSVSGKINKVKDISGTLKKEVKFELKNVETCNLESGGTNKYDEYDKSEIIKLKESSDMVESISSKLENLKMAFEADTPGNLVNPMPSKRKSLMTNCLDLSCSSATEEDRNTHSLKQESCSVASEKETPEAVSQNECDLSPLKILKQSLKNESASRSTKDESAESCSKNKTNLSSNAESSNCASQSKSNSVVVAGKVNDHSFANTPKLVPNQEETFKPSKTESDSKKPSVFKKERRKNKKLEEKNDRKVILLEVVKHIEKCIREWITFDSLIFLLGEESVKKLLKLKGTNFNECQNFCGTDSSTYEKYLNICRKLNMLELEDARADSAMKEKNAELKPLPDYSLLKREAKQLEIKVRSFYDGSTRIELDKEVVAETDDKDTDEVVLPLVDLHAQKALRRRIVLDRLNAILPDLGRTLNLSIFNLTSAVRSLSQTFNFSSHNITFKPPEWYFIAMVLVKLLSIQDKNLKILLESGSSEKYLTLLLMNWGLDGGYLDRLVSWLTDIDYLLQKTS